VFYRVENSVRRNLQPRGSLNRPPRQFKGKMVRRGTEEVFLSQEDRPRSKAHTRHVVEGSNEGEAREKKGGGSQGGQRGDTSKFPSHPYQKLQRLCRR